VNLLEKEIKGFAQDLVQVSGQIIRDDFSNATYTVETKADGTPVTSTDLAAEEVLRKKIGQTYPHHGIIGEEYGNDKTDAEYVWVIDPIDGTKSFLHGVPLFGTLIGLLHKGVPVLGLIHQPILNLLVLGDRKETLCNGQRVRLRGTQNIEQATLLCTNPADPYFMGLGPAWTDLLSRCAVVRSWGDCFGYLMVVSGKADIMIDPVLSPWDLLPLLPILQGAGVAVSARTGGDPVQGESLVACLPSLQAEVLSILKGKDSEGPEERKKE